MLEHSMPYLTSAAGGLRQNTLAMLDRNLAPQLRVGEEFKRAVRNEIESGRLKL